MTAIGIDLGTTNSVVAACDAAGTPRVLADRHKERLQPSVVSFHPNGAVIVGSVAKQRRVIDARNTVYSIKRLIGRPFSAPEVQAALGRIPFRITEGPNEQPIVHTRGGAFGIPDLAAIVLDHMRGIAGEALGAEASRAVITVPASFDEGQRTATATAGAIAGLEVIGIVNEPTAAALAYGHRRRLDRMIAVYDFGGGTFDITVLKLEGDVYEVLGTAGNSFLGGDDIDEVLVDHMVDLFLRDQNVDLRADDLAMQRLRSVAEQIKIQLSRRDRAIVKIDAIAYAHGGRALDLDLEIGREELVSRCAHVVEETFPVCDEALRLAQIRRPQITDVVLVGGTTRMPYIIERAARYFGRRPRVDVSPEEAVALGAALQAEALARRVAPATPLPPPPIERPESESESTDYRSGITDPDSLVRYETGVTEPQSGGFETDATDREVAVAPPPRLEARPNDRDVPVPPPPPPRLETRMTDRLAAVPPPPPPPPRATPPPPAWPGSDTGAQTVPRGEPFAPAPTVAARPTAKRSGDLLDELGLGGAAAPTIREVAPHTLGIGTVAGYCEAIIRRNTPIPQRTSRKFMTSRDGQRVVQLMVFQGESRLLHENRRLGALVLEGLPPRPRGETEIEVAFAVNESGMLEVAAVDTLTGAERRATVELIGAPSDDEVTESKVRMQRIRERK